MSADELKLSVRVIVSVAQHATGQGLPVTRVKMWETPTSFAEYGE